MSLFSRLRTDAGNEWKTLLDHPFPRNLISGNLSLEKYYYYLSQDDHYLDELLAALGMVIARTEKRDIRYFSVKLLHSTLEGELAMHEEVAREGNFLQYPPGRCSREYGNYLILTALRGNERDFFSALAPCIVSYREIAVRTRRHMSQHLPKIYEMWLDAYLADSYRDMVRDYINMLDSLASGITHVDYERTLENFLQGCRFEYAFWEESFSIQEKKTQQEK